MTDTEKARKVLHKCHLTMLNSLTEENVRELTSYLYSAEILQDSEKEAIAEIPNSRKAADKMLAFLTKK